MPREESEGAELTWTPANTIEDLTWTFIENGLVSRRQLAKHVVDIRGQWLLVAYLYQDYNRQKGVFMKPRIALVRYQRRKEGYYKKLSQFNLNPNQAELLLVPFTSWPRQAAAWVDALDEQPEDLPKVSRGDL